MTHNDDNHETLRKTPISFNANLTLIKLHYITLQNQTKFNNNKYKTMSITGKIIFKFTCITAMKERHHFV
jgi:hypothetical protein